jgi:hypothetical protein
MVPIVSGTRPNCAETGRFRGRREGPKVKGFGVPKFIPKTAPVCQHRSRAELRQIGREAFCVWIDYSWETAFPENGQPIGRVFASRSFGGWR